MNILLIVVDSLRADHLGISGYSKYPSPNIDNLALNGYYFPTSISTLPNTTPSIASILTGLYPHSHGIRFLYTHKLAPNTTTLQEILKSHGYRTIGNDIEMRDTGIEKVFDEFNLLRWRVINKIRRSIKKIIDWKYNIHPAETLTNFAIKKLNKLKDNKFFLYLHYMGLHWPYIPPYPYNEMFDQDYKGEHTFNGVNGRIKRGDLIFNNNLPKREIEHAIAHYDGALRYVDFHIGRLLKYLNNLNLTKNTLIILTGDHGESFGEHNVYFNHGNYLYDEELKVPLILSCPKLPKGRCKNQVQSTDIMPTILELLGIPLIDKIDGVSLIPAIKEDIEVRKYTFAESGRSYFKQNKRCYIEGINGKWRMIRTNEWKLICIPHPENDIYELYNLIDDQKETKNLIDKEPEIARILKEELFKWIKKPDTEEKNEVADLTERSRKLLIKAGYLE